jgi:hypothetical protein
MSDSSISTLDDGASSIEWNSDDGDFAFRTSPRRPRLRRTGARPQSDYRHRSLRSPIAHVLDDGISTHNLIPEEQRAADLCASMVACHGTTFEAKLRTWADSRQMRKLRFLFDHGSSAWQYYRQKLHNNSLRPPSSLNEILLCMGLQDVQKVRRSLHAEGVQGFSLLRGALNPKLLQPGNCERVLRAMRSAGVCDADCRAVDGYVHGSLVGFDDIRSTYEAHSSDMSYGWASHTTHDHQDPYPSYVPIPSTLDLDASPTYKSELPPCDGILYVQLIKCTDLLPADSSNNNSDPRVKLVRGRQAAEEWSKVRKETLSPTFDERFEFRMDGISDPEDCKLRLSVWDEDFVILGKIVRSRDFIGEVTIDLCREFRYDWHQPAIRITKALEDKDCKVKETTAVKELKSRKTDPQRWRRPYGTVTIEISFSGFDKPDLVPRQDIYVTGHWRVRGTESEQAETVIMDVYLQQTDRKVSGHGWKGHRSLDTEFWVKDGFVEGSRIEFSTEHSNPYRSLQPATTQWWATLELKAGSLHMVDGGWNGGMDGSFQADLVSDTFTSREEPVSPRESDPNSTPRPTNNGSGYLPPCDGALRVTVVQCEDLVPADQQFGLVGKYASSDPYVQLSLFASGQMTGDSQRTETVANNLSPRFNETKTFRIASSATDHSLRVEVFDADMGSEDDFLGERTINLRTTFTDCDWSRPHTGPWNLRDPRGRVDSKHRAAQLKVFNKQGLGHIKLKLEFVPDRSSPRRYPGASHEPLPWWKESPRSTLPSSRGILRTTVVQCTNVLTGGSWGDRPPDPLVRLRMGSIAQSTDILPRTVSPIYNAVFEFDISPDRSDHAWLLIDVWDAEIGRSKAVLMHFCCLLFAYS